LTKEQTGREVTSKLPSEVRRIKIAESSLTFLNVPAAFVSNHTPVGFHRTYLAEGASGRRLFRAAKKWLEIHNQGVARRPNPNNPSSGKDRTAIL
jgi:hypothetical protein